MREVGNALNSILSYMTRGKTLDVLESSGIQVFTDSTKTQFRNFMDVIRDISTQWNKLSGDVQNGFIASADEAGLFNEELADTLGLQKEWSDVQKRDVSNAAAGVYRRNYFLGLVQGFEKTTQVMNDLNDAQGYTLSELDKKLQTLDARFKILLNTLKEVAVNLGNEGALAFAKALVDMTTGLVKVIDKVGIFNIALIALGGILGSKFALIIPRVTVAIDSMVTSMGMATGAATTLSTALSGILVVGGILLAVKAFDILYTSVSEQKKVVEELANEYNTLTSELQKLRDIKNPTEGQQLQITLLERELELQNALLLKEKERLMQKEVYGKGTLGNGISADINEDIGLAEFNFKNLEKYKKLLEEVNKTGKEVFDSGAWYTEDKLEKNLSDTYDKLIKKEKELIENRKILQGYVDAGVADDNIKKQIQQIDEYLPKLQEVNGSLNSNASAQQSNSDATGKATFNTEKYAKSLEDANKATDDFQSNAKNISSIFDTINDGEKISANTLLDLIQNYPTLTSEILNANTSKEAGIKLTEALFDIEKTRAIQKLEDNKKILESEISILEATAANMAGSTGWASSLPKEAQLSIFGGSDYSDKKAQLDGITQSIEYLKGLKLPNYSPKKDTTSKDPYKDSAESAINDLQYLRDKDKISEAEYYNQLEKLNNKYFANKKKYLDDYRKYEVEVYNGRKQLAEKSFDDELKSWKSMFDSGKLNIDEYIKKIQDKLKLKNLTKDQKIELTDLLGDLKADKLNIQFEEADKKLKAFDDELAKMGNINTPEEKAKQAEILGEKFKQAESELKDVNRQIKELNSKKILTPQQKADLEKLESRRITLEVKIVATKDDAESAMKDLLEINKSNELQTAENNYNKKIKDLEESIYGKGSSQELFEETSNAKIKGYQDQIDLLEKQNELIDEQNQRAEKQLAIEKQKQLISNLSAEKTVRIYKQEANNGLGGFVYEADQKAISEQSDKLKEMQDDLSNFENDLAKKRQIEALQSQIQHEQDIQQEKQKSYEKQKSQLDAELKLEQLTIEQSFKDIDALVVTEMDVLKDVYGDKWDEIIGVITQKLEDAKLLNQKLDEERIKAEKQQLALVSPPPKQQVPAIILTYLNDPNVPEYAKESMRRQYGIFDTGGVLNSGSAAVNKSGKPERILSPTQTQNFDTLVKYLPDVTKLLKQIDISKIFTVPKFNFPTLSPSVAGGNGGEITTYNLSNFTVVANNPKELITQLQNLSANR